jgi:hypothetical protein
MAEYIWLLVAPESPFHLQQLLKNLAGAADTAQKRQFQKLHTHQDTLPEGHVFKQR